MFLNDKMFTSRDWVVCCIYIILLVQYNYYFFPIIIVFMRISAQLAEDLILLALFSGFSMFFQLITLFLLPLRV